MPQFQFGDRENPMGGSKFFKNVRMEISPQTPSKKKVENLTFLAFSHAYMPIFMSA